MPTYEVTAPDGKKFQVTAPEGATEQDALAYAQSQWKATPQAPDPVVTFGASLREIPRQLGLTARYGIEGLAQVPAIFTEPMRAVGEMAGLPKTPSLPQTVSGWLDKAGFPQPQTPTERVVGDMSRTLASGGGMVGGARAVSGLPGMAGSIGQVMAANPGLQAASAIGAGGAGGAVREAGGGPGEQFAASLLGGVLAPAGLSLAQKGGTAAINLMRPQLVEDKIRLTLRQSGVDYDQLAGNVRQQLQDQARIALRTGGDLDPDAMRRLLDFARVPGATPTRGTLTLDPVQITREKNLAKIGANASDDGLQGLAGIENRNNRALIDALNNSGASTADDAYTLGQRALAAPQSNLAAQRAEVNRLYFAARDSQGRSFPLDGRAFADRAIRDLDDQLVGGFLPQDVRNHLNRISRGEVPFTVDYAEQLKTLIGNIQRNSNDGNVRTALSLVRGAIDDTPVMPLGQQNNVGLTRSVNPGNLPAVAGDATVGEEAVAAFNQARHANAGMMRQIENSPALTALYEGQIAPEKFIERYIVSGSASVDDVQNLGTLIGRNPQSTEAVRGYIARWLKQKALNGAADEVGNFSPSAYNKALESIGQRKLSAFFSPEEISQLQSVGRVGSYMNVQPRGSAVNNSNSGALVAGKGLDLLNWMGAKLPFANIGPQLQVVSRGLLQRRAQDIPPSLLLPQPTQTGQYALPAAMYGGLLTAFPPREQ